MKQLPRLRAPEPDPNFKLIDPVQLEPVLASFPAVARARVLADIQELEAELMPLFREQDARAAYYQNQHRLYQITYIMLATAATILGSAQALSLAGRPAYVPVLAFGETVIALFATYLATISGREPPYPRWLDHRRKAETLRREYFRYLMNLQPYQDLPGDKPYERKYLLAQRCADINRGMFPEERRTL
jgi:hypothetical protein